MNGLDELLDAMSTLTESLLDGGDCPVLELGDLEAALNYYVAENLHLDDRTKMYWRGAAKTKELRDVGQSES